LPLFSAEAFITKENNIENYAIDLAVLACLAAIIDTPPSENDIEDQVGGIDLVISHPEAIRFIVSQWDKNDMNVREAVLQILTSMSWFSRHEGFPKVFDSLNWYRELYGYRSFWTPFVESLKENMEFANYARHIVRMLNVLLLCVQEFDSRVDQRRTLEGEHYQEILDTLKAHYSISKGESGFIAQELIEQIDLYETIKEEDKNKSTYQDLDLGDPDAVYAFLKENCLEAGTLNELTNCLHMLAAIPRHQEAVWTNCQLILAEAIQPKALLKTGEDGTEFVENIYPSIEDLKSILTKNENAQTTDTEQQILDLKEELKDLRCKIYTYELNAKQKHYSNRETLLVSDKSNSSFPDIYPNLSSVASFGTTPRQSMISMMSGGGRLPAVISETNLPTSPPPFMGDSTLSIPRFPSQTSTKKDAGSNNICY